MRQIKFRAWDKKKGEWLLGYEYKNLGGFSMFGEVMAFGEWTKELSRRSIDSWDDISLMQFTGLLDKNGKEIYEGDIISGLWIGKVASCDVYGVVDFSEGMFGFNNQKDNQESYSLNRVIVEVLGNIYENPDLLGK